MDIFNEEIIVPANINYNNINKAALGEVSGAVVDKVVAGEEDALEVFIKAKALAEVANGIINDTKALALDEAEKYSAGESKLLGCEFIVKQGSVSYSFSHDSEWNEINEKIAELKKEQKAREKKMIDATNYAELVDEDTGEVVTPAEIKKSGGSILAVTIPKS
jgi:uncharacterized membrane protein YkoI